MKFLNSLEAQDLCLIAFINIVAGILLCFFNVNIILIGTRILGIVLALAGLYMLYIFFSKRVDTNTSSFFAGLPSLLIGILMVVTPESVVAMLPILIGILFIISSIFFMQKSFVLKDLGMTTWTIPLGSNILFLIAGIVLLLDPIRSVSFILQLIGFFLILQGVFELWNNYLISHYKKQNSEE